MHSMHLAKACIVVCVVGRLRGEIDAERKAASGEVSSLERRFEEEIERRMAESRAQTTAHLQQVLQPSRALAYLS